VQAGEQQKNHKKPREKTKDFNAINARNSLNLWAKTVWKRYDAFYVSKIILVQLSDTLLKFYFIIFLSLFSKNGQDSGQTGAKGMVHFCRMIDYRNIGRQKLFIFFSTCPARKNVIQI
jgi:hypothetical protein